MISLTSTILALATLSGLTVGGPLARPNTLTETSISKRADPWHYCADNNWRGFNERAFLAGLRLMGRVDDHKMGLGWESRAEIPDQYYGIQGQCTLLWCGGAGKPGNGVNFILCLKPDTPSTFYPSGDLAKKFHDGFHDCNGKREPQDDGDNVISAYHVWADGYDLHVEGGYDGMRCPEDMKKTIWHQRPDSLNYKPYTTKDAPA